MRSRLVIVLAGVLAAEAAVAADLRLETVLPGEPGKNRVRWWEFDWRWTEFAPVRGGAPVRLFFYEAERDVARLAKPFISAAYEEYARRFAYTPTKRIPFHLYNSHFEFESTTAFLISEGVLGVTSTEDLTVALPYWGEHRRFLHVMRHELAHQFTIQKVNDAGDAAGCQPLPRLPLWFVEGIAEFFSLPTLTPQVRAEIADRFLDRERRRKDPDLPGFFEEEGSFDRVYLLGHAQARFLEERYGPGTIERLLTLSPRMCDPALRASRRRPRARPLPPFTALVEEITGSSSESIENGWREWAEAAVGPAFESRHALGSLELIRDLGPGEIDSFALSPDGRAILYRMFDGGSGVSRLYLRDLETGAKALVDEDRRFGLVSLHPRDRRVEALGANHLAYVGRIGATDRMIVRPYRVRRDGDDVTIDLGRAVQHDLSRQHGLIEAGHPAFVPGDRSLGFVGLSRTSGVLDLYRLERPLDRESPVSRLSDDLYAESGLAFTADAAAVFATDATPDARFEIARRASPAEVLTSFPYPAESIAPSPGPSGGIVFQAGATGFLQAYQVDDGGAVTRLTDVPTSLEAPAVDARGRLLGIVLADEERRLAAIPRERWLDEPVAGAAGEPAEPWHPVLADLGDVHEYAALSASNWRLLGIQGAASTGDLVIADVAFTDRFRARVLGLSLRIVGDVDRTNADLVYIDRSGRLGVGGRIFLDTGLRLEPQTAFLVRRFGGQLMLEWPFNRYLRISGGFGAVGLQPFEFADPGGAFARGHDRTYLGAEASVGVALDTLQLAIAGPYAGVAATVGVAGTAPLGGVDPSARASLDVQAYRPIVPGYERLFVHARLAAGTSVGGIFGQQFFVPPQYNLRSFPSGFPLVGEHYWVAQAELQLPLLPSFGGIALQGVAGVDAGAVAFDAGRIWDDRSAAVVLGGNLLLGPVTLRLHFARPLDAGGLQLPRRWLTHFTVSTPFFGL